MDSQNSMTKGQIRKIFVGGTTGANVDEDRNHQDKPDCNGKGGFGRPGPWLVAAQDPKSQSNRMEFWRGHSIISSWYLNNVEDVTFVSFLLC